MYLLNKLFNRDPLGGDRSPKWSEVRNVHIKANPTCAVSGSTKNLEVHHIMPFHLHPELELDPTNLITLSRNTSGIDYHLLFGHLGSFKSYNENVIDDAKIWLNKITTRPN